MPRYLAQFSYTAEAWKAMAHNPQDRTETVRGLCEKLGGKMEALYYSFGEYDGMVIAEMPDNATATAFVIAAVGPGHIKATKTTVLLTAQETMQAMQKSKDLTFQGPQTS